MHSRCRQIADCPVLHRRLEGHTLAAAGTGGGNKLEALEVAADLGLPVIDAQLSLKVRCTARCVWFCVDAAPVLKHSDAHMYNSLNASLSLWVQSWLHHRL